MSFRVKVLARAERDIDEIYLWIAKRSPRGAGAWYRALLAAANSLKEDAPQFALAPEAHSVGAEVRELLFKTRKGRRYRLLYVIVGDEVRILRVRGPGQPIVEKGDLFG